jgi:hypothetical protein
MLNKNDPLVGAIQDVMRKNQAERDAVKAVNEKFGVHDRRVLPREKQGEWDAAYKSVLTEGLHPNQQKLDVHEPEKDELTKHDFKMLRSKKKSMEEENAPKTDPYAEGQASSISTVPQPKKEVTPSDQSALKKKIQSIKEAKSNAYAIGMAAVKKSTGDEPPMEKKNITKAHKIAKKILAKKKMNEGFNNRHDSSVTSPVEGQVVAEAAKARSDYGLGAAAAPKDAAAARAKIDTAMEPVVNVSKALVPGATAVDKLAQGDYKGAAVDAGISLAGGALVGGALKAGKAVYNAVKGGSKVATGAEKVAAGVTKALPAPAKPVSQAAKEPAASVAAKPVSATTTTAAKPVSTAAREGGTSASTAAANASKYNKPGTVGGRFSDKLAQARKGSENYGPSKGGVAVRKTTEPATVTRPGVPAVAKKPGVPAVANRPGVPAAANRPGLPVVTGSAASTAAKTSRFGGLGKALKYGAVAAAVGGAGYGLMNKSQPDSTQAATPPSTAAKQGGGSTTAKTQPAVKPGTQQAAKNKVVQKVATNTRSRLQSRNQRDDTIGASGRPTQGPGGVKSGTKTGKIITNRPSVVKKNPVGMGRVK